MHMAAKSTTIKNILSKELREHYHAHGVTGIESYITQDQTKPQTTESSPVADIDTDGTTAVAIQGGGSRFIRLNPRFDKRETLDLLTNELTQQHEMNQTTNTDGKDQNEQSLTQLPLAVPWISPQLDFYAIPNNFHLSQSRVFREGRVYGMDVSSGAAVDALLFDNHDVGVEVSNSARGIGTDEKVDLGARNNDDDNDVDNAYRVLDLCCAPGLKTCAIADLLKHTHSSKQVFVVGVDISEKRMQLCRNIVRKYHIDTDTSGMQGMEEDGDNEEGMTIQLYNTDGTAFGTYEKRSSDAASLMFDSTVALEQQRFAGKRKRMNRSAKARERKRLKSIASSTFLKKSSDGGDDNDHESHQSATMAQDTVILPMFDRVLVDAECSTDGAVRHIQCKYSQLQSEDTQGGSGDGSKVTGVDVQHSSSQLEKLTTNSKLTDARQLEDLVKLQRKLIASGFRLLRKGGILVYSTCSLAREQNEDVVMWLMEQNPDDAEIVPVSFSYQSTDGQEGGGDIEKSADDCISTSISDHDSMITDGLVKGTVRFHPATSITSKIMYGGGFFMAKIRKKDT